MSVVLHGAVVALAAAVGDVVWARYTLMVSAKRAGASALWAVLIILVGVVSIDAYIQSRWYVVPSALGAAVGTFFTVRHARNHERKAIA